MSDSDNLAFFKTPLLQTRAQAASAAAGPAWMAHEQRAAAYAARIKDATAPRKVRDHAPNDDGA